MFLFHDRLEYIRLQINSSFEQTKNRILKESAQNDEGFPNTKSMIRKLQLEKLGACCSKKLHLEENFKKILHHRKL